MHSRDCCRSCRGARKTQMKVSSLAILLLISRLFLGFINGAVADDTPYGCPTNLIVDTNSISFPFNTTYFRCSSVWSSQDFILMYQQTSDSLWSFVLSAPNNVDAYIAVGFSSNGKMVGSSAIVGWLTSASGGVAKQYYLGGKSPGQCPPDQGYLQLTQGPFIVSQNWRIYLGFQLNTPRPSAKLIYALGPQGNLPGPDNYLSHHSARVSTYLDYFTGRSSENEGWSPLQKAHGAASLAGWGVLLPIGMLVARFGKSCIPRWLYAHAAVQTLAFGLGIAGVVTGFILEKDVSVNVDIHKGIGIGIAALAALQVSAVLLRPKEETKIRKFWNWYHHNVGRVAIALAIGNIFYGLSLAGQATSWFIGYGCYLGAWVLVFLALQIWMVAKK